MKFLVLAKGYGEGCDYTIGCNQTSWEIDADSVEEALQLLKDDIFEDVENITPGRSILDETELGYETLELYSAKIDVPVDQWRDEIHAIHDRQEQELQDEAERQEYERLKKKFGK